MCAGGTLLAEVAGMLDLSWAQGFGLVVMAIASYFGGRFVGGVAHRAVYRRVLLTRTRLDDRFLLRLEEPFAALGVVAVWQLLISFMRLPVDVMAFCRNAGHIGLLITIAWGAIRGIDMLLDVMSTRSVWLSDQRVAKSLVPLARRLAKGVFGVIVGVMVLARLGFGVGPLLVLIAIVGAALALAAARPLENVLAAYAILGDHGIREGDHVKLDSGMTGVIEAIGLYSTRLRADGGAHVIVPNRKLADAQIERVFHRPSTQTHACVPPPSNGDISSSSSTSQIIQPSGELS
jgi:small-conductance mechanosensitive channel